MQARSIACVANSGATREQLRQEALASLAQWGGADRFGLWLSLASDEDAKAQRVFRGIVWDADSETTPREWMHLAPQFPLPRDLLLNGKSVMQEVEGTQERPLLGPLAGLNRVLWVPVQHSGRLYGIMLAGARTSNYSFPREQMEAIAAELALSLELESERQRARRQQADLELSRQIFARLTEGTPPEELLAFLVQSCTQKKDSGEPLAVFAAIGRRKESAESSEVRGDEMEFVWNSGATGWREALEIEAIRQVWSEALEAGQTKGREVRAPWSNGERIRVVAMPLHAAGRAVGLFLTMIRPETASLATLERLELRASPAAAAITALHRKEEESHRDAETQALLDAHDEPLVMVSREGRLLRKNRAAQELFRAARKMEAGGQFLACIAADGRAAVQSWLHGHAVRIGLGQESGTSPAESLEAELEGGRRVLLRLLGGAAGESLLLSVKATAGYGRKESSREATELLTLVEWLDQGVVLFDARDQIRMMNVRFAQQAGLSPSEMDKINSLEGLIARIGPHTADPESFAEQWRELARSGPGGAREEVQLTRPVSRVLERLSRPVLDGGGKKLGRIEIYRDLTAQRIFQARLLQTEKLAALGQMVSGVAHELSNPLTGIVGYAQRLLMRTGELGHAEEVHRIFTEAERASAILKRLLLSARETPPEKEAVSLNQVVRRTVELQRFSLAAEKVRVEMDLDPLLPPVRGDAGQLQQVLMNLIGNARQAMEEQGKGGTIRLKTERLPERRIRLEVNDTGPGIPEAILSRIFDPFFTTKPAGAGTGLGLSIVLSIVREHGGQVYVQSPPGKGASFTIELPAFAEARESVKERKQPGRKRSGSPNFAPSPVRGNSGDRGRAKEARRVLVVEDEPTVAQLIADVLREEGYQVEILPDGSTAPQRAASAAFDLVICDIKMPGLDGRHFYHSLELAGNPLRERFLFVTGDVLAPQTREFLERTHLPYVAKPFRLEELMEKVQRVLLEAEQVRESAAARKNAATKG